MDKTKWKTKQARHLKPCKPGETHNPNGRPKGQRNYSTLYRIALERIAKAKDMTPEEIEAVLHETGLGKALKGDYNFYRDTLDRLHGKPLQKEQLDGKVEVFIKRL